MAVTIYHTDTIDDAVADFSVYTRLVKELVALIVNHTPATVYQTITDESTSYSVILHPGYGTQYIRISVSNRTASVARGHISSDSDFVVDGQIERSGYSYYNPSYRRGTLAVANGGAAWQGYAPGHNYSSGVSSDQDVVVSCGYIKPQFDTTPWSAIRVASVYRGDASAAPYPWLYFPDDHRVRLVESDTPVRYFEPGNAKYNVPAGSMLLHPTPLWVQAENDVLGSPTVGGHPTYFMSDRSPIRPMTEFRISGRRYVSLGQVCVLSD